MKKLILSLLITPIFALAQLPQNDRWTLLYQDHKTQEKTYVDNETIICYAHFDCYLRVYLISARTYHHFSGGKYSRHDDQSMAVALGEARYEVKSVIKYSNGHVVYSRQYKKPAWVSVVPKSREQYILNYLEKLDKKTAN
jgi:hypothetical protein